MGLEGLQHDLSRHRRNARKREQRKRALEEREGKGRVYLLSEVRREGVWYRDGEELNKIMRGRGEGSIERKGFYAALQLMPFAQTIVLESMGARGRIQGLSSSPVSRSSVEEAEEEA